MLLPTTTRVGYPRSDVIHMTVPRREYSTRLKLYWLPAILVGVVISYIIVVLSMSISDETGGELQALTPELIETINGVQHNVLKSCYISILKRLAKSAPNIDLYVR